jgi:hypothetical protein
MQVPAVILICRNSTDTAYFQRLRPYPRIMLRRGNARFKDYDKTPIGFGVAVFCIAKATCKCASVTTAHALPIAQEEVHVVHAEAQGTLSGSLCHAHCRDLYERFFDGFASMGEPNIPIDKTFMQTSAFYELLERLKRHSEEHQRDHWCKAALFPCAAF